MTMAGNQVIADRNHDSDLPADLMTMAGNEAVSIVHSGGHLPADLMKVASNPALADPHRGADLPPDLMTMSGNEVIANVNRDSHSPADLMHIADSPTLSERVSTLDLPPNIETVYELSLMSAPALEQAIEEGRVTSQTTREEAKALHSVCSGQCSMRHLQAVAVRRVVCVAWHVARFHGAPVRSPVRENAPWPVPPGHEAPCLSADKANGR
jgi:hypothetical protein